ncbi:MAG: homocysteine S-methyltransferase family protein [Gemmatimonadota bacterium]|nr:MAG: homocysteine S-methyltransferase family protein [Gemmatimonadota bacterium]
MLLEALRQRVLLFDGAVGTELQKMGLEPGGCGERWNVEHPERILAVQRAYVEAGSECLIAFTFGASRARLAEYGRGDEVEAISRAGVRIARDAFAGRPGYVLGDLGPLGALLEPYGDLSETRAREAYTEQAAALVDANVDGIIIETQTSLEELGIAVAAARDVGAPCIIGSVAFDVTREGTDLHTIMGVDPEAAARYMTEAGVDVLGVNCGTEVNAAWSAVALQRYRSVSDLPTMAQPNAGQPTLEGTRVVYKQAPQVMAEELRGVLAAGARAVGGCCGTTPEHIRHFRAVVDAWNAEGTG